MSHSSEQSLQQEILTLRKRVETLQRENRTLTRLAHTDGLTGLDNRREAERGLARETSRASRYNRTLSIIMFDLDHFKMINDTFGHPAGDAVLVKIGAWLQKELRAGDLSYRWGGDEFLILCPETGIEAAAQLAERLRSNCEAALSHNGKTLTASFGVSAYAPNKTGKELIRLADQALYNSKKQGGNQVQQELPASSLAPTP